MNDAIAIHGHEIIDLVAAHPDGIRLSALADLVTERFGSSVTFHTCSAAGMDLDAVLAFLEAREKVRISGGMAFPGDSPPCDH